MSVIVYGPAYSTYARTARLVLEEKGVPYELVEVDLLQGATKDPVHLARNPFAKVPVLEHDGFMLYETGAIARYVDHAMSGPSLTPADPKQEAVMNQVMGIVDSHLYPSAITQLFIQRVVTPMMGGQPDEAAIEGALPAVRTSLGELDRIIGAGPFVAGEKLSLGDLHLVPVMAYLGMTPEAEELLAPHANLRRWWQDIASRQTVTGTQPSFG